MMPSRIKTLAVPKPQNPMGIWLKLRNLSLSLARRTHARCVSFVNVSGEYWNHNARFCVGARAVPLLKPANRLLGIFAKLFAIARAGIVPGYPLQLRNGACGFERDERFDGSVADIGVGVFEMYY